MSFTYVESTVYNSSSSNTSSCAIPTGTQNGDIMFATTWNLNATLSSTNPTGWTKLATGVAGILGIELRYKIASSESGTYNWTYSTTTSLSATVSTFRGGFNPLDPIDEISNNDTRANNTELKALSFNVTNPNSALIFLGRDYLTSALSHTKPTVPTTDWVEHYDAGATSSDMYNEICSMTWTGSGATGNIIATINQNSVTKHVFVISLNPEVANTSNFFQLF